VPSGCGFDSFLLGGGYGLLLECSEFKAADIRGNYRLFHNRSFREYGARFLKLISFRCKPYQLTY
jgi:hypothetical protein